MIARIKLCQSCTLLFSILLLVSFISKTNGFASWLNCYVELDEEEVIMNHPVTPAKDSPHPVTIQVRTETTDESKWSDTLTYPLGLTTTVFTRLAIPPELANQDLQYVIEVSDGAIFLEGAVCDGKRAVGGSSGYIGKLVIDGTSAPPFIELVAGWATGHEAVKLTPRTTLKVEGAENEAEL